jgi:DNA-directed RNA polymerase subunit RPC12/RpoP
MWWAARTGLFRFEMKTREKFLEGKKAFEKQLLRRAWLLIAFIMVIISLRWTLRWLPHEALSWLPIGLGIAVFVVAGPVIIIHMLIGGPSLRKEAWRCGYICENCSKPLVGSRANAKKLLDANRCPYCGLPLFQA